MKETKDISRITKEPNEMVDLEEPSIVDNIQPPEVGMCIYIIYVILFFSVAFLIRTLFEDAADIRDNCDDQDRKELEKGQ